MAVKRETRDSGEPERRDGSDRAGESGRPGGPAATVRAVSGVARVAASAVSGTTRWGVHTALDITETVVRGSMAGLPPAQIRTEAVAQAQEALRRALGVAAAEPSALDNPTERSLREQGAALLRLAASPRAADEGHPAFARILAELTSDEARILRLLRLDGPQPAVTVRGGRRARRGSRKAEQISATAEIGVSMIGEHAGLRHPDRVQRYLANLRRIGLIELLSEPVGTPERYQLLEAQAPAIELLKQAGGRGKLQHRGIALTPFGGEFVQASLPITGENGPAAQNH
ncbi:Abi-alpha family protein [Nocardia testacea]|uniref:Abi-alpha family protein n=1 Tax=Nocardia testacea TaxID=248551 RepID=UPI000688F89C|nr:Abi-alpha family protein [Nocardia testacea]